ncbi:MAG: 2OG-Fe(II) oxygenase [Pseudomonadota bacterium]
MKDAAHLFDPAQLTIYPVAHLPGTLPEGGVELDTPIYAVQTEDLLTQAPVQSATRRDVDLGHKLAFVVDNVLSRQECRDLIALTEHLGYSAAAPGIQTPPGMRRNKTVHWLAGPGMMGRLFARLQAVLPPQIEHRNLTPALSHRINMYRYDDGDVFNPHIDGDWPGVGLSGDGQRMEHWPGTYSMLTMLLYLNDQDSGATGGATVLYDHGEVAASILPKTGSALFFRHGNSTESVLHAGEVVTGQNPKYVARINVMYETT